ncbi:MAG: hypothetical protein ABIT07_12010 [Ferruginibacter sp.]
MNTQSKNLFVPISKEEVKSLTQVVSETLATASTSAKIFSSVDMWNILRQRKSSTRARRYA